LPVIAAFNLTFSEVGYGEGRCHKRSFLGSRAYFDISNVGNHRAATIVCPFGDAPIRGSGALRC
jgi:hypothetical protein